VCVCVCVCVCERERERERERRGETKKMSKDTHENAYADIGRAELPMASPWLMRL